MRGDEGGVLLVAVDHVDVVVAQLRLVEVRAPAGAALGGHHLIEAHAPTEVQTEPRDEALGLQNGPIRKPQLLEQGEVLRVLVGQRMEDAMVALIGQIRPVHGARQRRIAPEQALKTPFPTGEPDPAHHRDDEVPIQVERRPRTRQLEGQHAHGERDLHEPLAALRRGDGATVHAGRLIGGNVDGREELLERTGVERERLKLGSVREGRPKRIENRLVAAGIELGRLRNPDVALAGGVLQPGVVRHLLEIDLDQILVVHQQLGDERQPHVLEIADPGVSVLEPDLDHLQIDLFRGQHLPALGLQIGDGQLDALASLQGIELKRSGFKFRPRRHDAQFAARAPVLGVGVGHPPHVAHRRDGIPGHGRIGDAGGLEIGGDARPVERGIAQRGRGLRAVHGVVEVARRRLGAGRRRSEKQRGGRDRQNRFFKVHGRGVPQLISSPGVRASAASGRASGSVSEGGVSSTIVTFGRSLAIRSLNGFKPP